MKTHKIKLKHSETLCGVIMILLTWFVSLFSFLYGENWTALLSSPYRVILYIFGPLGSILFCYLLYRFSVHVKHPMKKMPTLTAVMMPLSLLFVYDPINHASQTTLHLTFSYLFFFGVNFCFASSMFHLYLREPKLFRKVFQSYLLVLACCIMLATHFMSINTLFELTFTTGMTLILMYINHTISHRN